jgi:hypothetical protein
MHTVFRPLRGFLALTVATLLLAPPAWSSPITETVGDGRGTIDWTHGTLTVTGSGAPPDRGSLAQKRLLARRAAVVDGYRQLAEMLNGVRVDSETVVKDFVIASDLIRTQVSALVKGAKTGEPRYLSDGTVEVDLVVSLYGPSSLFAAIDFDHKIAKPLPQPSADTAGTPDETPVASQPEPAQPTPEPVKPAPEPAKPTPTARATTQPLPTPAEPTPPELTAPSPAPTPVAKPTAKPAAGKPGAVTAPARPEAAKNPPAGGYTGVIIDCRDISVQPAMSPAIMDEGGKELYVGKMPIDPDMVINIGIVGYASTLDEAMDNAERIGKHPLILKAKRTSGPYKADVVLSTADTAELLKANDAQKLLTQSRVMFVLKP